MKHVITKLLIIAMLVMAAMSVSAQDEYNSKDDTGEGPPAGPVWDLADDDVVDSNIGLEVIVAATTTKANSTEPLPVLMVISNQD